MNVERIPDRNAVESTRKVVKLGAVWTWKGSESLLAIIIVETPFPAALSLYPMQAGCVPWDENGEPGMIVKLPSAFTLNPEKSFECPFTA